MVETSRRTISIPLFMLALAIGVTVSVGERIAFAMALDRAADWSEAGVIAFNALLLSIPFLYLAYRRSGHVLSWLVGLTLTLAGTGWSLSKGIAYQRAPDGSGVDMFDALLMLLAPFAIAALFAVLNSRFSRR